MTDTNLRARFPALETCTYLNTAGGAPIPDVARDAAVRYYDETLRDGDVHWDAWHVRTDEARRQVGSLVGAKQADVAFLGNASIALNLVAQLDEPAAFAYPATEFPSGTLPWLRRGFTGSPWAVREDGSFDADDVAKALTSKVRVVVLSSVQFSTGFRADLDAISVVCRNSGVRLVVDATQGVAAFPINVSDLGIDALVFSGYKWMTAGYGVAGLVVPGGLPDRGSPFAGWRSQADPYALEAHVVLPSLEGQSAEAGHPPFAPAFAMGASARLWNEQTPERTSQTILGLMTSLHEGLDRLGIPCLSSRNQSTMSGITMLGVENPGHVARSLTERGILTSPRGEGLRVSMHAYNTQADIDVLLGALEEVRFHGSTQNNAS